MTEENDDLMQDDKIYTNIPAALMNVFQFLAIYAIGFLAGVFFRELLQFVKYLSKQL